MSMLRTLISLAAAAMLINLAMARSFTVGGPTGGWDTTTNLQAWASTQAFSVGDNLIFQTTPYHNVLEVSKTDYDSCQNSNPIQIHSSGSTPITLISPGNRYFICGTTGHCIQGMKVEIVTLVASATPPAPPPTTPTPTPDSPVAPLASSPPTESPTFSPSSSEPTEMPPSQPLARQGTTSSPSVPPTESSARYTPSSVFSPPPPFSSAAKVKVIAGSIMGFACVMMVLVFL